MSESGNALTETQEGRIGHDCAECAAVRAALDVAMTTLEQIATTPRNKGARRNAYSTLAFLRTQLKTPTDQHEGPTASAACRRSLSMRQLGAED